MSVRSLARLAGVAGLCALAACGGKPAQPQRGPPVVGVVVIAARPVALTAELPGRVTPSEIAEVRPQVNGIIEARLFTEGQTVRAGQALYQIDPAPYRAASDQAKAALANAQAAVVTARAKAARYADLVKINAVSRQDADDAEAAYKEAVANVAQQKAALETARINLGYTRVTAPIGGRVGLSAVTKGALVTNGQTNALTTVQRLDPTYVDVTQSSAEILGLRKILAARADPTGAPVTLKLEDGSPYALPGRLSVRDITVDQTTGAVTLRATFPNPAGLLLPGMYVEAIVDEGTNPAAVLAPQQGIQRDPRGRPTAFVVDATGHARLRDLVIGRAVGNAWLVTSGLAPGDRLIVEGLLNVQPGEAVRAAPAAVPVG